MGQFTPGQIVAERFKILEIVGQGGNGTVYKVEQVFLEKLFALKVLNGTSYSDSALQSAFRRKPGWLNYLMIRASSRSMTSV